MAIKGKQRKEYMRGYMREYMRKWRKGKKGELPESNIRVKGRLKAEVDGEIIYEGD